MPGDMNLDSAQNSMTKTKSIRTSFLPSEHSALQPVEMNAIIGLWLELLLWLGEKSSSFRIKWRNNQSILEGVDKVPRLAVHDTHTQGMIRLQEIQ